MLGTDLNDSLLLTYQLSMVGTINIPILQKR